MKFILSFDQGTTSCRSIIFDQTGAVKSSSQKEFAQIFPQNGWVEHDAEVIWETQKQTALDLLKQSKIKKSEIAALGIANQRETVVVWNRQSGQPICNAIVWQDRRTANYCQQIKSESGEKIRQKTGLETDAYFSASKLNWILNNIEGAKIQAANGALAFGTIDSWLIWKLTGGKHHLTDATNASRTLLFNIHTLEWDFELLKIFDIPPEILPQVKSSSEIYGEVSEIEELRGVPVSGVAGDQQAALFGQTCFKKGATKNTYGTGCFMLQNTGMAPVESKNKLLTTVAWQAGGETQYALEGSVFIGGAVIQWLRDSLHIISRLNDVEQLAQTVADNDGVYFVPAFTGLGTPHWDQNARGMIIGLTRGTEKGHIARAALESIAFQTADLLDAMQADSKVRLGELRVDGGATENNLLLQFQSDILQIPIVRASIAETTALGAAYLAGLAIGFWQDTEQLTTLAESGTMFVPQMPFEKAKSLRERWQQAVSRSLDWEK